ncbi:MAG TPA: hypothetical protein VGD58_04495 [Herpetosiphonaceae bacterium]
MTAALRRAPVWMLVLASALLASALTLALDRGVAALRSQPTPTATVAVPEQPIVVLIETPEPEIEPSVLPDDEEQRLRRQIEQQSAQHLGATFVLKAERQVTLAMDALATNDSARADRELVAAQASLDEAFRLVSEDLKPQINTERLEIGRIRADLEINPRSLDEDLRKMRDRLLSLIVPR